MKYIKRSSAFRNSHWMDLSNDCFKCTTFLGSVGSFGLIVGIPIGVAVFGIILVGIYRCYKRLTSKRGLHLIYKGHFYEFCQAGNYIRRESSCFISKCNPDISIIRYNELPIIRTKLSGPKDSV